MNEEKLRILQMVGDGKITADEAEKLLSAMEASGTNGQQTAGGEKTEAPKTSAEESCGCVDCGDEKCKTAQGASRIFPLDGIRLVRVCVKQGDISITGGDFAEITAFFDGDEPSFNISNGVLLIETRGSGFNFLGLGGGGGEGCDISVKMPGNIALELKSASGDLAVKNISVPLSISAVNGDMELENVSGDLKLSTVNGDLSGKVGCANAKINAVNGDMRLEWQSAPRKGLLTVSTVSGDMDFSLPADTPVDAKITSMHGERRNDFAGGPGGFEMQLKSMSGDIAVKKL